MSNATIERMCSAVSADAMMQDLSELARRIKLSGTKPELESFHYLQRRMEACGFRTRLIQHDAYISLPGGARLDVGNAQVPCITHSFSQPSPPAACTVRSSMSDPAPRPTSLPRMYAARWH